MSKVDFKNIPIDMYRKILLKLDPEELINLCETDSYAIEICDDNFFS